MFTDVNLPRFLPVRPRRPPPALGEHCISRHACPSSPHENTHTILTRSFGWLADIILVIMRIHMHQEALYIYIYTYTHTQTHVLHAETRKETGGSRDPLLPSTSLSIRTSIETRDDIPFSAPPSLEYIDPRGRKGIEIDPALARIRIACWRLSGRMVG